MNRGVEKKSNNKIRITGKIGYFSVFKSIFSCRILPINSSYLNECHSKYYSHCNFSTQCLPCILFSSAGFAEINVPHFHSQTTVSFLLLR